MAVVISKSEQKAAFIDLKPLFSHVNGVYFSPNVTQTSNLGQADSQWPYTFANTPSQTPTVVKTVSLAAKPTAVKTTLFGSPQRAWIATQDGTLHIYSIDGYAPGGTAASPSASAIAEVGTVTGIGRNPTSLAASKGEPADSSIEPLNRQILVTSRGDRKVSWVRFASNGNSGTIVRTLTDTRLVDPIAVEDADNFANAGYLTSVLDYAGKAVRNYRYGPVIFSDGGACPRPNGCAATPTTANGVTYNIEYGWSNGPVRLRQAVPDDDDQRTLTRALQACIETARLERAVFLCVQNRGTKSARLVLAAGLAILIALAAYWYWSPFLAVRQLQTAAQEGDAEIGPGADTRAVVGHGLAPADVAATGTEPHRPPPSSRLPAWPMNPRDAAVEPTPEEVPSYSLLTLNRDVVDERPPGLCRLGKKTVAFYLSGRARVAPD